MSIFPQSSGSETAAQGSFYYVSNRKYVPLHHDTIKEITSPLTTTAHHHPPAPPTTHTPPPTHPAPSVNGIYARAHGRGFYKPFRAGIRGTRFHFTHLEVIQLRGRYLRLLFIYFGNVYIVRGTSELGDASLSSRRSANHAIFTNRDKGGVNSEFPGTLVGSAKNWGYGIWRGAGSRYLTYAKYAK